jgi:hypothetical protein
MMGFPVIIIDFRSFCNYDIVMSRHNVKMAPIGTITRRGAPFTLKPEPFGPGFARLGIVRYYVTAGSEPGVAQIEAQLSAVAHFPVYVNIEACE